MDKKEPLIRSLVDEGYLKTPRIIEAFHSVDRADFVLPKYKDEAYGNYPLPLGEGQTISQPLTVAFMLELLEPREGEKILDIGAGSGWQTALLAEIVGPRGQVIAVERISRLCNFAKKNLEKYGFLKNGFVKFYCWDATANLPEGPYDKIIVAAAAPAGRASPVSDERAAFIDIPQIWREKLKVGGKIVAPVAGSIWLFTKKSATEWEEKEYPGFAFVPLVSNEPSTPLRVWRPLTLAPRDDRHSSTGSRPWHLGWESESPKPKTQNANSVRTGASPLKTKNFLIFLTATALLATGFLVNEIYFPHPSYPKDKSVQIEPGLGSRKIADLLKKERIIRSKWAFIIYVSLKGAASGLKPGLYEFGQEAIPVIVQKLVRGGTNEITITIPEGWGIKDIAEYLEKEKIARKAEFLQLVGFMEVKPKHQGQTLMINKLDFLKDKPAGLSLEGYLFPDTYRIFKGAEAEDVIVKMLENFEKKLTPDLRTEIARQDKTIFEIIVMASLIEKEVSSDKDRVLVSEILWKRLKLGIGLQVDATIIYLTGKKSTKISKAETEIDSSYNTYKYRGLPPGPIANPGLSAIRAAIYPKDSPYLYYLSAPDGRTIFSKTLEEHNQAKIKYLTPH